MKVHVFGVGRGLTTWDFDWYCGECHVYGTEPAAWQDVYLAAKFHATVAHGPHPQAIRVLEAEVVPEWQTILVDWLDGKRNGPLDFDFNPIPMRLLELLAAAQRGGW